MAGLLAMAASTCAERAESPNCRHHAMSICTVPVRSVRQTGGGVIVAACGEGGLDGTQPASVTSSNIDSSDCFIEAPLAPGRPGCPLLLPPTCLAAAGHRARSEEHTSELQPLMRISYAV